MTPSKKSVKKLSVITGDPKMTMSDSIRQNPIYITLFEYARSLFYRSALNFLQFDIYIDHIWKHFWLPFPNNGQEC